MHYSFIILSGNKFNKEILNTISLFEDLFCIGKVLCENEAVNLILEKRPDLVIVNTDEIISTDFLIELSTFIECLPFVIVISNDSSIAYKAIKHGVNDFLLSPIQLPEFRKSYLRFIKNQKRLKESRLVIKSNSDYNFLKIDEILYLNADNNTTDIYLVNGKKITAYKTLKFFENQLPFTFLRIHNSYIVNIKYVTRINIGKSKCYIENLQLPFSRTYKENIDVVINRIS